MSKTQPKPSILIIGAGELGAATGVSLVRSGRYGKVTIIDRAQVLPAIDAASCDYNKVVRMDYMDDVYATLAKQSIDEWRKPEWKGIFHETGVVVRGLHKDGFTGERVRKTLENVRQKEPRIKVLERPADFVHYLQGSNPSIRVAPPAPEVRGYYNPTGGWANATGAVNQLYKWFKEGGGEILAGASFTDFIYSTDGSDVRGVKTEDGRELSADKVIIAMGSWSPSHPAIKGLLPDGLIEATGQTVMTIQLTPELHAKYASIPVSMHHDGTGYYTFPPNDQGIIKFALHRAGYVTKTGVPRTAADPKAALYADQNQLGWIPRESYKALREQLAIVYPELAKLPVTFTRMCYYSDVVDGDWVFDYSPKYSSLLFATGGAGHAFKFLPIIGDLIRQRLVGTLDPKLAHKWRCTRQPRSEDPARVGMSRQPLDLDDLVTKQELVGVEHLLGERVNARL